jgi:hypothetical protein
MNKKKNSTWRLAKFFQPWWALPSVAQLSLVKALGHCQGGPASQRARARKFIPATSGAWVPLVSFTGCMPHPPLVTYGWAPSVWFGTNLGKDSQQSCGIHRYRTQSQTWGSRAGAYKWGPLGNPIHRREQIEESDGGWAWSRCRRCSPLPLLCVRWGWPGGILLGA